MNPSTSNAASNALIKATTLFVIVMAAATVAAGITIEAAYRRSQIVRTVVQQTAVATGYFDPCNADQWGMDLPIQVKMQFRQQCEEQSGR